MLTKVMLAGAAVLCCLVLGAGRPLAAQPQVFTYNYTFQPGTEPDGFRGIKWQTDIATLDPLHTMTVIEVMGPFTYYKKNQDDLNYGTASLVDIIYEFWNGKFSGVIMRLKGENQFRKLRDYCFARFGRGQRSKTLERLDVQDFYYNGLKTRMYLKYSDRDRLGELSLYSIALLSKQEKTDALFFRDRALYEIKRWEKARGK
jgi:hypothetical protein